MKISLSLSLSYLSDFNDILQLSRIIVNPESRWASSFLVTKNVIATSLTCQPDLLIKIDNRRKLPPILGKDRPRNATLIDFLPWHALPTEAPIRVYMILNFGKISSLLSCPFAISTTSTLRSTQTTLHPVLSFRKMLTLRRSTNYTQVDWSLIQRTNFSSSTILPTSNHLTRSQRSQSRVRRDLCLQAQTLSRWDQSLMAPTDRFTARSPELD